MKRGLFAMQLITTQSLTKIYGIAKQQVYALRDVNLNIDESEFVAIMGPSGSGKSTLLYLLGGLDRPTSGTMIVNDQRLDEMDENRLAIFRRETVGFIFQSFNLIQSMTAEENVGFP